MANRSITRRPALVMVLTLVLGFGRTALDRPRYAGGHVIDPDVEVDLHALTTAVLGQTGRT